VENIKLHRSLHVIYDDDGCSAYFQHPYLIFFPLDDSFLLLQDARKDGYDFITTNLPHSSSLQRQDVTLMESKWWSTSIVGMVSSPPMFQKSTSTMDTDTDADAHADPNTDVDADTNTDAKPPFSTQWNHGQDLIAALSSNDRSTTAIAENYFTYMLDWAAHMNIPACVLPPIPNNNFVAYGRYLATQALKSSANNVQLWVRVAFDHGSLERFNHVHKLCDGALNLGCVIMFDSQSLGLITSLGLNAAMALLHQFIGCNLRAVSFNTDIFLVNKQGFPALPKSMQFLFMELLKRIGRTCRVLVEGVPIHRIQDASAMGRSGMMLYLQYLRHIRSKDEVAFAIDTEEARMETGYLDHLQSALQPLGDNLEFSTYEVVSTHTERLGEGCTQTITIINSAGKHSSLQFQFLT
jgi:protein arginine N-methyltransferase 5